MARYKTCLTGIAYLEQVLRWEAFAKGHPKLIEALRDLLNEYYILKENENVHR